MTDKKPTLKLKLSGEAMLRLQAKIPKPKAPEPKRSEIFVGKGGKVSANNALNKAQAKRDAIEAKKKEEARLKALRPKMTEQQCSKLENTQFWALLLTLQKKNPKCFTPKGKNPRPLKIGIHKDIAQAFNIPVHKAYQFVRIYFKFRKVDEVTIKGAVRRDLRGKNAGIVE